MLNDFKNIVTHKSPDLDSCVAIWILKRFVYPDYKFNYLFVDVGVRIDNIENSIHVDTGGIDYDHHDSDEFISAASLVFHKHKLDNEALKEIVNYTVQVDHGKTILEETNFMDLTSALTGLLGADSESTLKSTLIILDGIYSNLVSRQQAEDEINKGIQFKSSLGTGLAFATENPPLRKKVYQAGYDIFLFKDSKTGFAGYKVDGNSKIDLSSLYTKIKEIEPNSDWFLHSSNQLLLCGSSKAPTKKLTKLTLEQLISIIEEYA